ncbi:MAG: hypothetical protein AB7I24_17775 [Candidatus Nanopelagicales bacterium]
MSDQNPTDPIPGGVPEGEPAGSTPPPPPPPPAPADSTPPPPPPAAAAPVPPPAAHAANPVDGPWSVGNAFSYGWAKFQQYLGPILIAMLILFLIGFVISIIWFFIVGAIGAALTSDPSVTINPETGVISTTGGTSFFLSLILGALGFLVYYTVFGFIQAAVTRAALAITEGRKIESSTILSTDKLGKIIVAAILVAIATSIGYLFCGIGALIVSFFLAFTFFFVIDKDEEPVQAIKSSFALVKDNLGDLVLFYLASVLAYFVGSLLCGIGLLVAVPVVIIATAYTYKKFTSQAVAA